MQKPGSPPNEINRVTELKQLALLDSLPERAYDNITKLASQICGTPISLISLVDDDRQWFKSRHGLAAEQTPRDISFCGHAILSDAPVFAIPDAVADERFADNPLVMSEPKIAFYAGAPLRTSSGHALGTLCVIDREPRQLSAQQFEALRDLADQVMLIIEAERAVEVAKLASQTIEEGANLLRLALVGGQMGTWAIDLLSGRLTGNEKFREMHGHLPDTDDLSRAIDKHAHDEDRPRIRAALKEAIATGQPYSCEYRNLASDGTYRWIFARGEVGYHTDGHAARLAGISIDIHDRKTTELRLSNERYQLDQIFAKSPAAMATWFGDDLVFERVNPDYQLLFPDRQLVGRALLDAVPELRGQGFDDLLREVMRTGKYHEGKEVVARISPSLGAPPEDRYFTYSYIPIYDSDGKAVGVYDHAFDVTETVRSRLEIVNAKEAAERANAAKSTFLANMSHEIRTPLGAIIGFAEQLRAADLSSAEAMRYLDVIERNSEHLLRIIDDVLDLSKVEAGMLAVETIEFSLTDLLRDVSSLMKLRADEKGINFDVQIETDLPTTVISDPTRIRQILINIVTNAIKFTDRGHVKLSLNFKSGQLEIRVSDTGIGIAPEQRDKLFSPFQQADSSMTRKFGGTGLGLALTRKLCESMGGTFILANSAPSAGSTFLAKVAIAPANHTAMVKTLDQVEVAAAPTSLLPAMALAGAKILLVEDSPDNQVLLKLMLTKQGANVDIANDGVEGVKLALTKDFDIVLCDMQMPRMDGYGAVRELRSKGYTVPIVALTAHAMKEEYAKAMRSGFSDYLTKPVKRIELITTIQKYYSASSRDAAPSSGK